MRHYPSDSAEAVARVIALALLADGAADKSELDYLKRRSVLDCHGISSEALDRVTREFYEDLISTVQYQDALQCRLDWEQLEGLLAEVADTRTRAALFRTIQELTRSDGHVTDGEAALLSCAACVWNMREPRQLPLR